MAVDVRSMPLFDLTLIPFLWTETGMTHRSWTSIEAMAADPENHELTLGKTRTLLPVGDLGRQGARTRADFDQQRLGFA